MIDFELFHYERLTYTRNIDHALFNSSFDSFQVIMIPAENNTNSTASKIFVNLTADSVGSCNIIMNTTSQELGE